MAMLAASLSASGAEAHAFLERASPRVGSTVGASPPEIRIWFTEPLEPRFSGAELTSAAGERIGSRASASGNQLVLRLPRLKPGVYRVTWHVVSVDTHKTEGSFTFEVRP